MVLLKRPAKAAAGAEIGIQPVGGLAKVRNDDSASNVTTDVICLAGCVGSTGAKVFKGRQMAWIQQDGHNSLAHAMADLANSIHRSDEATAEPVRTWVSQAAREGLIAITMKLSDANGIHSTVAIGPAS